jgi:hypothetical protein
MIPVMALMKANVVKALRKLGGRQEKLCPFFHR